MLGSTVGDCLGNSPVGMSWWNLRRGREKPVEGREWPGKNVLEFSGIHLSNLPFL